MIEFLKKHFVIDHLLSVAVSVAFGIVHQTINYFYESTYSLYKNDLSFPVYFLDGILEGLLLFAFFIWPIFATIVNVVFLFYKPKTDSGRSRETVYHILTLSIGGFYSFLVLGLSDVIWADWSEQLVNNELHSPIYTHSALTVAVILILGIAGLCVLKCINVKKIPPLVPVLCISAVYIFVFFTVFFSIQIVFVPRSMRGLEFAYDLALLLYIMNIWVIAATTIKEKVLEYRKALNEGQVIICTKKPLGKMQKLLVDSYKWPLLALIFMWPLLALMICILLLFGQRPDEVIRAFTQTTDWAFSTQVGPPNLIHDMHYLCTAAAVGHEKVVKPIRLGERHGHKVVVNRQLCVANAFEEVLMERHPKFHKAVRNFYDTYGFPIAKKMKKPIVSDIVYYLMKPLEWFFDVFLYLFTSNPEERIASQYIPKKDAGKILDKIHGTI